MSTIGDTFSTSTFPVTATQLKSDCWYPFQAIHQAFLLSVECQQDHFSLSSSVTRAHTVEPCRSRIKHVQHSVNFSNNIEILFPDEDELGEHSSISCHERVLTRWPDKPWKLRRKHPRSREHQSIEQTPIDTPPGFQPRYEPIQQVPQQEVWLRQPDHVQDLAMAFNEFAELDQNGDPFFKVMTWYLHGIEMRDCRYPRIVRPTSDFTMWTSTIRSAWRDLLRLALPIWFHVVHPEPPFDDTGEHSAHLILTQSPQLHECASLFTTTYFSET